MVKHVKSVVAAALLSTVALTPAVAAENVKLAWSHYTGWEPWGYIESHHVLQDKMVKSCGAGSTAKVSLLNDYAESLNQYTSGAFDGVASTNMDAIAVPGVGGRKTTMLVVSDYSDGNDAVISGDPAVTKLADLRNKSLNLEALTVSQYLLDRGLEEAGLSEKDMKLVNTSDADMGSFYQSHKNAVVVTWNPIVRAIEQADPKAAVLYTSAKIPGEIIDAMAVRSDLAACAKDAIRESWFDTVGKLKSGDQAMVKELADQAGGSVDDFQAQIKTTHFFWTADEADRFVRSPGFPVTAKYVRDFVFDHGMYGDSAKSASAIGIRFTDGRVLGDGGNVVIDYVPQVPTSK